MADRSSFCVVPNLEMEFRVSGRDLQALLFNFLDEILCMTVTEPCKAIKEIELLDYDLYGPIPYIFARCHGEPFDRKRHTLGTEVKAITYSNMKISTEEPYDIHVVVDI